MKLSNWSDWWNWWRRGSGRRWKMNRQRRGQAGHSPTLVIWENHHHDLLIFALSIRMYYFDHWLWNKLFFISYITSRDCNFLHIKSHFGRNMLWTAHTRDDRKPDLRISNDCQHTSEPYWISRLADWPLLGPNILLVGQQESVTEAACPRYLGTQAIKAPPNEIMASSGNIKSKTTRRILHTTEYYSRACRHQAIEQA